MPRLRAERKPKFDTNGNGRPDAGDAYWNDGKGWLPIGDPETESGYKATFIGYRHTIANLFINRTDTDYIGLFSATESTSDILQVDLVGVRVSGKNRVGALVGNNNGSIVAVTVHGLVSGVDSVGGLTGYNDRFINSSRAAVAVSGNGNGVGGLAGSSPGRIRDSSASGSVNGRLDVGGLVGENCTPDWADTVGSSDIIGSYATGAVNGRALVGGLIGHSYGLLAGSYATGEVTSEGYHAGGLAGTAEGEVTHSYATGRVTGDGQVGGLVGQTLESATITYSYATGSVTGRHDVGGLVGYGHPGNVTDSYWDTQTSDQPSSPGGGVGKTTRELQSPTCATGIYANWYLGWWDLGTAQQYPALKPVYDPRLERQQRQSLTFQ